MGNGPDPEFCSALSGYNTAMSSEEDIREDKDVQGEASDAHTVIGRICAKCCKLRSPGGPEGGFQITRVGQSGAREECGFRSGQA